MTLRCRPGDLAVTVGYNPSVPNLTGRIVEVIELAPVGVGFNLPDGKRHVPVQPDCWVIKFSSPVDLSVVRGRPTALYAACWDRHLQPLRDSGADAQDETLSWLDVPETTPATLDGEVA